MQKLIASTNSPEADRSIEQALGVMLEKYDGILSSYVAGSYANNYAIPSSDIDLYLIFEEKVSKELYEQIEKEGESLSTAIEIDLIPTSLEQLKTHGVIGMDHYYLHVWGKEVHQDIPSRSLENEIYIGMHGAYMRMELTRKEKPFIWPLEYPSSGELKGYDWRDLRVDGIEEKSIKEIVVLTGWMATGLVTWIAKEFVPTKKHCPEMFSKHIGGEVAEAFQEITEYCRNKFHYKIPKSESDLQKLKTLLPKVLMIENYFLEKYQDFLIENLESQNPVRVRTSLSRLGEIVYPNMKSIDSLSSFQGQNEEQEEKRLKSLETLKSSRSPDSV